MTVCELKKLIKEKYNKELSDEEAEKILNQTAGNELSDEQLEEVAGGRKIIWKTHV